MTTPQQDRPVTDRVNDLSDAEMAYVARWVALKHPQIAEEGLEALAFYEREYPDQARMLLGAKAGE